MADNEPKSWGETIRAYETSKKVVPWQPKEVEPVTKLSAFERRTLEREMDPVLMQYRNPEKEMDFTQTLQAKTDAKRTKGQAGQPFNIINHAGPPRTNVLLGSQNRGTREWNVLSHMPEKLHAKAPTEFNQDFQIECTKRKSAFHGNTVARGRDYSILSNKFNENDSARRLEEYLGVQDHLRKEYTRTRIYDPIKVQSYDPQKEQRWQTQHQEEKVRNRNRQEAAIPKSTKYAEGNTYNILTTEVINADRLMQKPDRALNRYKGSATKIEAAKVVGDQRATVEDARRLNRISYDRWEKTIDRGFDFVFGGPVELQPVPKPRPSIWTRLHTDAPLPSSASAVPRPQSFRTKDLSNLHPSGEERLSQSQSGQLGLTSSSPLVSNRNNSDGSGMDVMSRSMSGRAALSHKNSALSHSNSARSTQRDSTSRVPALNLNACPMSPVSYQVPKNSLPGEPIAMVRTGGGLSSYN
mmetsp:Transcript_25796/g.43497  ORF Transcript_25796/g.43497 Transcript_25796/m.43497 type:complete len:468 (-) Transcript_25796:208-1611(-)